MRFHAPPGAPLQAAVDRLHGHGLFLPTLASDAVDASSTPLAATCVADASTAHTKGAWVEVTAATSAPWNAVWMTLTAATSGTGAATPTLLDIGIGAAGSEVVVVPNVPVGYITAWNIPVWQFPASIPKGSRVAVRCQSLVLSKSVSVYLYGLTNTVTRLPGRTLVNIGANTAASTGVQLATPAGANTEGAWTELTASAPQSLQAVTVCISAASDAGMGAGNGLVDIGIGAAGAETVIVPNLAVLWFSSEAVARLHPTMFPVNIPKGARVVARYQGTVTTSDVDVALIGVPA